LEKANFTRNCSNPEQFSDSEQDRSLMYEEREKHDREMEGDQEMEFDNDR
jgi:hypothetical protein